MKRYAFVSIMRSYDNLDDISFDTFYNICGANLGNMMFANAVWDQVDGFKERIPYQFGHERVNREFDGIVIPAANWLGQGPKMRQLIDSLEKVEIPVIVIGLGAQAPHTGHDMVLSDDDLALLKVFADRSHSIGVRGPYTAEIIKNTGIGNPVVVGCPSLYQPHKKIQYNVDNFDSFSILFHATRYGLSKAWSNDLGSIDNRIFKLAYETGNDILFQSEPEELALLFGFEDPKKMAKPVVKNLVSVYGAKNWKELSDYLMKRGKAFASLNDWGSALENYSVVVGTRLHGTIKAFHSGKPAILISHDSRTQEIAEHFHFPSISAPKPDEAFTIETIKQAFEGADFADYEKRRAQCLPTYKQFLQDNGIATSL